MKKKIFFYATAALVLTACSSDEPAQGDFDGSVAAQVSADIEGVRSRAAGTTWDNGDAIGISTTSTGKTSYANMKYVTTGDGSFTHDGGAATGIFFQDTQDVTFSAYYPFTGDEKTAARIISNVTTENQAKQKQFDFLFASSAKANYAAPQLNFTGDAAFSHKMTRLIVNIKTDANSDFTASDVTSGTYTISGIKHSGTFNTATGEATATGNATDDWAITATAADADGVRTYSMILYPQNVATLTLKATIADQLYTCDLTPALASGMSYTYTITVRKTGLTVSNCTINSWGDGGNNTGDATMPLPLGNKTAVQAAVGDFYMKDGSLVDKDAELNDEQRTGCIGVVFSIDADRIGAAAKSALGGTSHGLVMALTDASTGCYWGVKGVDETGLANTDNLKKMYDNVDGYAETQWIISNKADALEASYPAFYYASVYGTSANESSKYAAPANTTGWFIPSMGQWWDILTNLGGVDLSAYKNDTSESMIRIDKAAATTAANLNTYMNKIPGASRFDYSYYYWSSDEYSADFPCGIYFYNKNNNGLGLIYDYKASSKLRVRCILAF